TVPATPAQTCAGAGGSVAASGSTAAGLANYAQGSWAPGSALAPATYYWRARGTDNGALTGAWASAYQLIIAQAPVNTVLPGVSGPTTAGQVLTTTTGTWTGNSPINYTYQWRRCDASGSSCADIGGATASNYTLVDADIGSTLRAVVTGTNSYGASSAT